MISFNNLIIYFKSKSLKSILFLLILYITAIIGFGKFFLIAYFQLPESYGQYALLYGVLIFIGCFISFGEIEQTIKQYPTYWIKKQYNFINESVTKLLLLMFFRASLVFLSYVLYNYLFGEEINLIVLISFFIIVFTHSVSPLFTSLFRSSSSLSFFAYSQLIRAIVTLLFVTTAAYYYSWEGLIVAEAISGIIIFPIYLFFINRQYAQEKTKFRIYFKVERDLFISVFKVSNISGLFLFLSVMLISIPLYLDKLIIGQFKGLESVGLYSVCFLVVQIGTIINNVLSQKAGPDFIKDRIVNKYKNLNNQLFKWVSVGLILQLMISIVCIIALKFGLIQYYLPEYDINLEMFMLACLLSIFQFNGLTEFALISLEREKKIFFSNIFYCILFLISFTVVGYLNLGLIYFFCAFIISKIGQLSIQFYFINEVNKKVIKV